MKQLAADRIIAYQWEKGQKNWREAVLVATRNILKPDAINSALYAPSIALGGVEDMGSRRSRGLLAGVALSAGRADACLAQRLRVVRPGPVVVGDSVAW